jgi:aminoglycoside 6'-N-acetyltransferase I
MVTNIRIATPADEESLAPLRRLLWPDWEPDELVSTLPYAAFVAEDENGRLIGFLETGLRSHADGCNPAHPVGFVEGWFVRQEARGQGIGKRLLEAAENWARAQGCTEMASDTWINNALSQRVHEALGFEVVDRCVHYRKAL